MASTGQTALIPSGPDGSHLFFLILGPAQLVGYGSTPQIILVSLCSVHDGVPYDPACVLEAGDHPFIQRKSYIAYRHMRVDSEAHVDAMLEKGVWQSHVDCTPSVMQQIIGNVCASKLAPREFKRLFGCS